MPQGCFKSVQPVPGTSLVGTVPVVQGHAAMWLELIAKELPAGLALAGQASWMARLGDLEGAQLAD